MLLKGLTLHVDITAGADPAGLLGTVSVIDAEGDVLWTSAPTPLNAGETLSYGPFSEEVSTDATFNAGPTPEPGPAKSALTAAGKTGAGSGSSAKGRAVAGGK